MKKKRLKMFASILLINCMLLSGCSDINSASAENSSESSKEYTTTTVKKESAKDETATETGAAIMEVVETIGETAAAEVITEAPTEAAPVGFNNSNQPAQEVQVAPETPVNDNEAPVPEVPVVQPPVPVPAPVYKLGDMTNYLTQIYGSEENFKAQYYTALNQIRASYGNAALKTTWILEDRALKVAQICGDKRTTGHPSFPGTPEMLGYGGTVESVILMPVKDLTETNIYDLVHKMTVGHTEQTVSDGTQVYCGINIYYFTLAESLYCTITLDVTSPLGMTLLTKTEQQYTSGFTKGVFYEYYYTAHYAGMTP